MQRYILVHGKVQGVNFRYFARQIAERFSIQGYVKNLPDSGVEVVAEGDEATLDRFATILWKGPPAAKVDAVVVEEHPLDGEYTSFIILY